MPGNEPILFKKLLNLAVNGGPVFNDQSTVVNKKINVPAKPTGQDTGNWSDNSIADTIDRIDVKIQKPSTPNWAKNTDPWNNDYMTEDPFSENGDKAPVFNELGQNLNYDGQFHNNKVTISDNEEENQNPQNSQNPTTPDNLKKQRQKALSRYNPPTLKPLTNEERLREEALASIALTKNQRANKYDHSRERDQRSKNKSFNSKRLGRVPANRRNNNDNNDNYNKPRRQSYKKQVKNLEHKCSRFEAENRRLAAELQIMKEQARANYHLTNANRLSAIHANKIRVNSFKDQK